MKKLTKILVCFMLCVFGFGLVACGDPRTPEEKNFTYPSSDEYTYGNGGLAVRKGNYVYFVNGYNSVENVQNKDETFVVGSLMLMKLGDNGKVVTNENGLLKDEYFITMNNKLCGYEATNLFIFGDYLYFASPSVENESGDEVWAKQRVVINRIKLNKSSEVEVVYSSGVKFDNFEYQYYVENGNLFILAWEKGESYYGDNGTDALIRIDATAKTSGVISNNVTDVLFAESGSQIFFTKHSQDDDYYFLKQHNIGNNSTINYNSFSKTFDIVGVQNDRVFITIAHDYGSTTDIKSSNIANKSGFEFLYADSNNSEVNITPNGDVVLVSSNALTLVKDVDEVVKISDSGATSINIIDYVNGCILYYDTTSSDSHIKLVSYSNALAGNKVEIQTLTTISAVEEDYAYFDFSEEENFLYFYKQEGSNYYLHRIKVSNNIEETEEMFGVYLEDDAPEVEVEEEEIEEE